MSATPKHLILYMKNEISFHMKSETFYMKSETFYMKNEMLALSKLGPLLPETITEYFQTLRTILQQFLGVGENLCTPKWCGVSQSKVFSRSVY